MNKYISLDESDGAEYISDIEADVSAFWGIARARMNQGIWTQRDGTQISVRDMSKKHIENSIAMLKRGNSIFKDGWIAVFERELANREYIRKCVNEDW